MRAGREDAVRGGARRLLCLAALVVVVPTGCAGGTGASERGASSRPGRTATSEVRRTAPSTTTSPVDRYDHLVAEAIVPEVDVYDAPGDTEAALRLSHPTGTGAPLVFLVKEKRDDGMLNVFLPVRPNGSTGWIRTEQVGLRAHNYRIVVELDAHRLTLYERDEIILSAAIGVGTSDTPTPGGVFYVKELLQPPEPDGPYGAYAYGLSGYSQVLSDFAGGDGVIGIHGTNDPSSIGRDVSHGCIRLDNGDMLRLVEVVPLGTPVEIRP